MRTSIYEPLRARLAAEAGSELKMSYAEVEKVLGRRLPNSAYGNLSRQWWANTTTHSQGQAWLNAGWRVASSDRDSQTVEFRRRADVSSAADVPVKGTPGRTASEVVPNSASPIALSAPEHEAHKAIVVSGEDLSASALRMIEDAAEECGGNRGRALAELLNRAAIARRRQLLDWFAENAPRSGS